MTGIVHVLKVKGEECWPICRRRIEPAEKLFQTLPVAHFGVKRYLVGRAHTINRRF